MNRSREDPGRAGLLVTRVPSTEGRSPATSRVLPGEVVAQSANRVVAAAAVIAVLWLLTLTSNLLLSPRFRALRFPGVGGWPWPNALFAALGVAGSLLVILIARRLRDRPRVVADLGLGYEVYTAALIALVSFWIPEPHAARISWTTALILLYPAIAPSPPRKLLVASFAAASMDAIAFGIARGRGLALDWPVAYILWMLLPNLVCAALALVPATLIRRLGRQVAAAQELGSYRLGRVLGAGGMGQVHEASHRFLARPAAIKLIRQELLATSPAQAAAMVERFHREAEAVAALRSPHTVQLYDFGVASDGTLYYAMELLDGIDLHHLVRDHGPVPPERAIHLLSQACDSLAEAHARGLVHRDIKPSNLFVCRLGLSLDFVKVLDFGLVRPEGGQEPGGEISRSGPGPGTPSFMAPEAVKGGPVDRRADVYSLGCVAYWLLSGHPVFDGDNPIQVMYRHGYEAPVPPSERLGRPLPPDLEAVVAEALEKDPDRRIQSAEELGRRLAGCRDAGRWDVARAEAWWTVEVGSRK